MRNIKRLNVRQKKLLKKNKINYEGWYYLKETLDYIELYNINSKEIKMLEKE